MKWHVSVLYILPTGKMMTFDMDTRVIFTDLDGTLLNSDKNINPGDLSAVNRLISSGHKFVISTGRPLQSAVKISKRYGWTGSGYYISSYNGGLIYDLGSHETIVRLPIPKTYVRYILDEAYKFGLHSHTYDDANVVSEIDNDNLRTYCSAIKVEPVIVENALSYLTDDPIKVIALSYSDPDRLRDFRQHMEGWCAGRVGTVFSSPVLLEFSNPEATKGNAVRFICRHLGIPVNNSIAVGDEENDISMIRAAGIGAAMCNGTDITKAAADYVTSNDNNHCGIAEVINTFVFS